MDNHPSLFDAPPAQDPTPLREFTREDYTLAMRQAAAEYHKTYNSPAVGFLKGMEESHKAAVHKWTPEQIAQVDQAITLCASSGDDFTADDVWSRLPVGFPVTKGLASRLNVAARQKRIIATDRTRKSRRGGDHDHGQRLTIWRPL